MTTTWIPLLVPADHFEELAALVHRRATEDGIDVSELAVQADIDSPAPTAVTTPDDVATRTLAALEPWDLRDLTRLATSSAVTAQRWARALDVCANHVGEFLTTQQVASESGMSVNEWRDAPRKLPRHLKANYPEGLKWPLAVKDARALGMSEDQVCWAITEEQARRWREVRGEGS